LFLVRVGLADDNCEFCHLLESFFINRKNIEVVFSVFNGKDAVKQIITKKIDVLLLDIHMPQMDGFAVLQWLRVQPRRPKVIILSAFAKEEYIRKATALGADYCIHKPFSLEVLSQRILEVAGKGTESNILSSPILETEITNVFEKLGIPSHYKGYHYLKDAIALTVKKPCLINEITKKMYPLIADTHHTKALRVERAMRFAIENTWNKGDLNFINKIFGYCIDERKGKPTNASFIAIIADKIRLEQKLKGF